MIGVNRITKEKENFPATGESTVKGWGSREPGKDEELLDQCLECSWHSAQ